MFEKYAPLLVAWQKQYGNQIRFAVVTPEGSEEASVIMRVANAVSRGLPPDQWIIPYKDATAAMTALNRKRFFTIEGLGLPLDHALLNKIPGFRPKTEAEMDQIASEFPGIAALLAQFSAQLEHTLETAA